MVFRGNTILGVFFISQLCVGVIGNLLLLMVYVHSSLVKARISRPIDPIFMHLMIVNILTIIFSMILYILSSFGVPNFLDDAGCKATVYIYRVTRGLSICTTSILSTFQAISITPSNSNWVWLKPKLSKWTCHSFLFSWFINLTLYVRIIETVIIKINNTDVDYGFYHPYCKMRPFEYPNPELFLNIIIIRDLFFVAIMVWTSLYMVILLLRHHKRAQHLHSPSLSSSQASPEHKATHSILLLTSCFVFFYLVNNFITLYGFSTHERKPNLGAIVVVVPSFYPTLCPFLLMNINKIISRFISSLPVLRIACFQRAVGE
ncbi:vomeronasal type-1 receptor 90-like [Acomys russatus]|uniref:vomeronasal type-1 receptor 90-like n=1 Tax=Acomys russatus TaxID=60746 RepID=UPI0021E34446|nr:vomeronasal type-1 receptor 90-like [Acomys russatus]